jgi:Uma2 family endonuclease
MSAHPQPRLTPEEYLELDRASQFRNEYYNGHMYAMSGGSVPHAIIIGNLTRETGNVLKGRPCFVAPSDLRVGVSPDGLYTYPDVVVVCGEIKVLDGRNDTVLNPILIIEVLSPSTEACDRGFKSAQYRTLETLQEYALVSQTEPRVEIFRRQSTGDWLLSEAVGLESICRFQQRRLERQAVRNLRERDVRSRVAHALVRAASRLVSTPTTTPPS